MLLRIGHWGEKTVVAIRVSDVVEWRGEGYGGKYIDGGKGERGGGIKK